MSLGARSSWAGVLLAGAGWLLKLLRLGRALLRNTLALVVVTAVHLLVLALVTAHKEATALFAGLLLIVFATSFTATCATLTRIVRFYEKLARAVAIVCFFGSTFFAGACLFLGALTHDPVLTAAGYQILTSGLALGLVAALFAGLLASPGPRLPQRVDAVVPEQVQAEREAEREVHKEWERSRRRRP